MIKHSNHRHYKRKKCVITKDYKNKFRKIKEEDEFKSKFESLPEEIQELLGNKTSNNYEK